MRDSEVALNGKTMLNGTVMIKGIELIKSDYLPKELVKHAKKHADNSFCCPLHQDDYEFRLLPKLPEGLIYSGYSGMLLKLRNCEPHTDFQVGEDEEGYVYVGACFGLLQGKAVLQVSDYCIKMQAGDWVLFDDTKLHSVQADRLWIGTSVQVLRKLNK